MADGADAEGGGASVAGAGEGHYRFGTNWRSTGLCRYTRSARGYRAGGNFAPRGEGSGAPVGGSTATSSAA